MSVTQEIEVTSPVTPPQASCVVDIEDSSGWTALHHAGGYCQGFPNAGTAGMTGVSCHASL